MNPDKIVPSEPNNLSEIRECLERSGYLLESRLVRSLTDSGYFVEPNQALRDPRTGKSREIDLVAELFRYNPDHQGVHVWTKFIIEALSNKHPFVLITPRPYTPGADFESYLTFSFTPDPSPFMDRLDVYEAKHANWDNLFSQYCVITPKKGERRELMASHPEDVYSTLLKLSEYVENDFSEWRSSLLSARDKFWRLKFWHPLLVLSGQLVTVTLGDDDQPQIQEAGIGRLEFNWHAGEDRRTTIIEVVTENFFLKRLNMVVTKDGELEQALVDIKKETPSEKKSVKSAKPLR